MNRVRAKIARLSPRHRAVIHLTRFWLIVLVIAAPLLAAGGGFAAAYWPYRYSKIHALLQDMFSSQVRVGAFHRIYFPHPGFVATHLTLVSTNHRTGAPLGTVETMFAESYWTDLLMLRPRVRLVEITRLHLMLPEPGLTSNGAAGSAQTGIGNSNTGQASASQSADSSYNASDVAKFDGPSTPIERLTLHDSVLYILRQGGNRYRFAIRNLELLGLQKGHAWHYSVDMENALPAAHIAAAGSIGPLNPKKLGATAVSGQFTVKQLKLSDVGILHGSLAATGRFIGTLQSIQAQANSATPDFAVDTGKPTPIHGSIECAVDALNGDVFISHVEVATGKTIIRAHGQVAGSPKITHLEIAMDHGRAEEVLRPFLQEPVPILGPATLHSHVDIAAPGKPFLQRLVFVGHFDAPAERDTDAKVEKTLSSFSRREVKHSQKPQSPPAPGEDVLSSIEGPATIRKGIISTTGLHFGLPGASATLHGTFSLENEAVHLTGMLHMQADISHATTGWKSVVLKFLQPFFRRKHHPGSRIPIAVRGTPGHYKVTQDILK